MQHIEFKVGDIVTYKPFEKAISAVVEEVDVPNQSYSMDDERVYYRLGSHITGRKYSAVNAVSSGMSIQESQYYEAYEGDE